MRDAAGRIIGASKIARDVSQQKRAEERIRQLMSDLQQADQRKDEFLATLAHELRGPLAPLRNSVEVMKLAGSDAAILERARDTMDRQLTQMERLIEDLLDIARVTRNKLILRRGPLDLAGVIQQSVESCRPLAEAAKHELTVGLPAEPLRVDGDTVRLTQVFGNLLSNACKYTDPGGHIAVRARREAGEVVVSVRDDGIGIRPDLLPRVFDIFTQVDSRLERARGGLGLGLALVKRLVEMHGGSVTAFSNGLGRGSEFTVRLPALAGASARDTGPERPAMERAPHEPPDPDRRRPPRQRRVAGHAAAARGPRDAPRLRRRGGGRGGRGVPARRGVARSRHAAAERLRSLPAHPLTGLGAGRAARRGDRLGPGRRSAALAARRASTRTS